jgi:formylglycine-generating enzyme required for sulfatase activity
MAGSVREWTADAFDEHYRHARGASWNDANLSHYRVASRYWTGLATVQLNLGFRIVRVPQP